MRTYGKRFLNNFRLRESRNSGETKNAIVWSIDEDNRKANVRIQGSNTTISAFFPTSWHTRPEWCKIGAPVRILFSGGNRGIIELLGPGTVIPYPQTGQVWPDAAVRPNQILSGLKVIPIPNIKTNAVMVLVGSALIGNVVIEVDTIMLDDDNYFLDFGGYLGSVAAIIPIPSPVSIIGSCPWPYRKYQITKIFVNAGGISYVTGWGFSCYGFTGGYQIAYEFYENHLPKNPVFITTRNEITGEIFYPFPEEVDVPAPADNLCIGSVVMCDDISEVRSINLNWQWRDTGFFTYSREPAYFINQTVDPTLDWGEEYVDIILHCFDSVGLLWSEQKAYKLRATIVNGTGTITDGLWYPQVYGATVVCTSFFDEWAEFPDHWPIWHIRYKRDNLVTDVSPTIKFELVIENSIIGFCTIELFDAAGDPMY